MQLIQECTDDEDPIDLKLEELQANMFPGEVYEKARILCQQDRAQALQMQMASQESPAESVAPKLHGQGCACFLTNGR